MQQRTNFAKHNFHRWLGGGQQRWRCGCKHYDNREEVGEPSSSTACELVALIEALQLNPSVILTDSKAAMELIANWSTHSALKVQRNECRHLVRNTSYHFHNELESPPTLGKVKAHGSRGKEENHVRALGNDKADALAKEAVSIGLQFTPSMKHYDPVIFTCNHSRDPMNNLTTWYRKRWWAKERVKTIGAQRMDGEILHRGD